MKKTHKQRVLEKLERDGQVSNVWAITQFPAILRLADVILQLKKDGHMFRSDYIEGTKNYCYWILKQSNQVKI